MVAFSMSHACVSVPGTEWVEPVLFWVSIGMPTGSGKSPLFKYLLTLLQKARDRCGLDETSPARQLEEGSFHVKSTQKNPYPH